LQGVDLLVVIDSSSSVTDKQWQELTSALSREIKRSFPTDQNSKLGVVTFATGATVRIPMTYGDGSNYRDGWAEQIALLQRTTGSTFTSIALKVGIDNVWDQTDARHPSIKNYEDQPDGEKRHRNFLDQFSTQ
jgi:uncharacterized protein YegL